MIKPLKDLFLVSANESQNEKTESGIFIDTTWDKYRHAVQDGIVESVPLTITPKFRGDVDIKVGDKVYFHHFVVQQDNYILHNGKKLFKADYYNMYCKIENGEPVMLEDWILAEPVFEKEEDIQKKIGSLVLYTKATPDKKKKIATVSYVSKTGEDQGLKNGDTIVYKDSADYDMKIEGKEYYRIKLANVAAIIRDNKIIPLNDEVVVENNFKQETTLNSGIIMVNLKPERTQSGKLYSVGVNSEYKEGDHVLYFFGTGIKLDHEGNHYSILRHEQVLGLVVN